MLLSYLTRISLTAARSSLAPRTGVLEELRLSMRVWPTDLDTYGHVNNGVYLTLMDHGRLQHWVRTGLFGQSLKRRWIPVLGASTVRYHRELKLLQRFELVTALRHWDDKWFFFEQRFERGGHVHAVGYVMGVVKHGRTTISPGQMLATVGHDAPPPPPPPALEAWQESLSG
ncbi:MAG: thioesterase family protein [Deltaproteobacteria bacterium]|nr:thioesterase family protein [Deltaproteobacteria bacterium]